MQATKVNNQIESTGGAPFEVPGPLKRVVDFFKSIRQFLHEVRVEMRQVTWPTWDDVTSTTGVVIVTVFFFGAFLALVDLGVSHAVERVFKMFK